MLDRNEIMRRVAARKAELEATVNSAAEKDGRIAALTEAHAELQGRLATATQRLTELKGNALYALLPSWVREAIERILGG